MNKKNGLNFATAVRAVARWNWPQAFVYGSGVLLLLFGLTKLMGTVGHDAANAVMDPALPMPLRYSLALFAVAELFGAGVCLFSHQLKLQQYMLAWVALNLICYLVGVYWMGASPYCSALVNPANPLRLPGQLADQINLGLPFLLLTGSVGALFFGRASRGVKMSCPACGGHIKFAVGNLGWMHPCPHCKTIVRLQLLEELRISCFFCHEHIVFPAHAAGTKAPCPHCRQEITLKLTHATAP